MSSKSAVTGLWIGDRLSSLERLCIKSFLSHGYDFHLYVYNDVRNVPEGATVKDGSEILAREDVGSEVTHSITYFSNLFRYKLLYELGGWWVDMDTICLKEFVLDAPCIVGSEGRPERKTIVDRLKGRRRFKGRSVANTGFLKFPARTEIMKYCFEKATEIVNSNRKIKWGELGPALFRSGLKEFDKQSYVNHWKMYCPVHLWDWRDLLNPEKRDGLKELEQDKDVFGVHLWNELWRRGGVDKNQRFDDETYIGYLLKKYDVEWLDEPT